MIKLSKVNVVRSKGHLSHSHFFVVDELSFIHNPIIAVLEVSIVTGSLSMELVVVELSFVNQILLFVKQLPVSLHLSLLQLSNVFSFKNLNSLKQYI